MVWSHGKKDAGEMVSWVPRSEVPGDLKQTKVA